ncbi:MAG: glycosyltransferase family 87 protein [Patescibacteria group bacterium]
MSQKHILTPWNVLVAIIGSFLGSIALVSINSDIGSDAEKIGSSAWFIMQGMLPYKEIIEVNQPGTLLYLMGLKSISQSDMCFRLADLLMLAIIVGLLWRLGKTTGTFAAAPAVFYSGFHLIMLGHNGTVQRDAVITAFVLGAAVLVVQWEKEHQDWQLAVAGLLIGCASTIKVDAVLFAIPLGTLVLKNEWRKLSLPIDGAILPLMAVVFWVDYYDALPDLWWVMTTLIPIANGPETYGLMPQIPIWMRFVVTIVAVVISSAAVYRNPGRNLMWAMTIMGALHLIVQNKGFWYHFLPILAFGSVAIMQMKKPTRYPVAVALVCTWPLMWFIPDDQQSTTHSDVIPVETALRNLPTEARIQPLTYVDSVSGAMVKAGRLPATGMVYDLFLFMGKDTPARNEIRHRFLTDVQNDPPDYFVTSRDSDPRGFDKLLAWPEFKTWLEQNYIIEIDNGVYRIYCYKFANNLVSSRTSTP